MLREIDFLLSNFAYCCDFGGRPVALKTDMWNSESSHSHENRAQSVNSSRACSKSF